MSRAADSTGPAKRLGCTDSIAIIVGTVIGAGIYETTPLIASNTRGPADLVLIFLIGGACALLGALCYTELATVLNRTGGDFEYLLEAYGRRTAFLFAWMNFWIVLPASVGATAYIFARYATRLLGFAGFEHFPAIAAGAVICLTVTNAFGLRVGTRAQKILTSIKVLGLLGLISIGFFSPMTGSDPPTGYLPPDAIDTKLAFILVMYAYGGWNVIVLVAAEVKQARRNVLRSLVVGITIITAIYVLAVGAFEHAMGHANLAASRSAASDVVGATLGEFGAVFISLLICVTCLANINATLLTNSRIFYAFGKRWPGYVWLAGWHKRYQSPVNALTAQGAVAIILIMVLAAGERSFERLVTFSAPVFWFFFLLASVSLFVLRRRAYPATDVFRVPLYPVAPAIFSALCAFMLYASIDYAVSNLRAEAAAVAGIFVLGCAAAFVSRHRA